MCPLGLSVSGSTQSLTTGQAKLWVLLVGVNQYQDASFPTLRYSAEDCQRLGEALSEAAGEFPKKQVIIHHDCADQISTLTTVLTSLKQIISAAKPSDTVLFYFSGHGLVEPQTQQAVLCLSDTRKNALLNTALPIQQLLQMLASCAASQQLLWLDACHSGGMTLRGAKEDTNGNGGKSFLPNPTAQLVQVLQTRPPQNKKFYALLSCDEGQQSWEFPELGHGLFTYYLMRGLRGEAANAQGVIEADGLYKYVYNQTQQYIEQTNQKLRQLNQQKRQRGETLLYPEYPQQTPKRIVVGSGELILGLTPEAVGFQDPLNPTDEVETKSLTAATSEATIVGTQPFLELNNQGQVLRFRLDSDVCKIGRDRQWSDLDIPQQESWKFLSRRQAVLRQEGDSYRIYDGDTQEPSRNGIFLNQTRIDTKNGYLLKHGMTLKIGQNPHYQILLTYKHPAKSQRLVLPSKRRLDLKALRDFPVVLGREQQSRYSSMQLNSPVVSRVHATIHQKKQGGYRLENRSPNGTFVNGKAVEHSVGLKDKDRIQIGPFTLLYSGGVLEILDRGNHIRLDAYNLRREVQDKAAGKRMILDDISLVIEPGQLVAIVGGSGTGKSTLMKTLLGIEPLTSGAVLLNGDNLRQHFDIYRSQIGYVPQDDILHQNLTVEEVLTYACQLRLPPDTDVAQVVKQTLGQIMLSHVKHRFVRDLSGEQRKRVSIGVELLAGPKLFFLDEPTSGLDPGHDQQLMKLLRELADQGRTVVLVTHATASIEECDRIAFMGQGGKLCYFGPPRDALNFFEMPSEDLKYFPDIYRKLDPGISKKDTQKTVIYWAKKFLHSPEYQSYVQTSLNSCDTNPYSTKAKKGGGISPWQQLRLLSERHLKVVWRDENSLALSLLTGPISISLLVLTLQSKTPLDQLYLPEATQASLALRVLLVFSCVAIWVGLFSSVQEIVKESAIYARERLINLGILPYLGSKFLIRSGLAIGQTILIVTVILLGFKSAALNLFLGPIALSMTTFLTLQSSLSLGLMLSTFVPNKNEANSALGLVMILQIIFSGALFELEGILSKLSWLMLSHWSVGAYGALVNVNAMLPKLPQIIGPHPHPQPLNPSHVYDATWQNLSLNWGILCLHTVIYFTIALYLQKRKDVL